MWFAVLGIILALVAIVFTIPLHVTFYASRESLRVRLSWVFGLMGRDISRPGRRNAGRSLPDKAREISGLFRLKGALDSLRRLVKGVLRSARINECDVYLRYGLDDPAQTGMLSTILLPLGFYLNGLRGCRVRVEPSFWGPAFEGHASLRARFLPVRVLPHILRFVFSPGGLRLLRYYRAHR